ncbi:unnamed protein product [Rhodiola kirilowii]
MAAMNGLWAPLSRKKKADADDEELNSLEEKVHSTIMLCLADDVITEVADEDTTAGLWLKLESLYMTKSLTNKLLLKQRLFSLRMQEGTPLRDHLDQLNSILLDLRNIDVKVDDEDAALILLVSLPMSYENFVESFIAGKDSLSPEDVRSALHTREGHGKLNRRKSNYRKFKSTGPTANDVCNYCKEKGHWKNECPKKQKQKQQGDGYVVVAEHDVNSEEDLALLANEQPHYKDVWVLDSGASYHICPCREWFSTYEQIDGGNISIANSDVCKAVGIGSIRIRTYDGSFCTLNEVRHVPQMTKNLISLSLLDSKGFSFRGYAAVASSEAHKEDMTKLWHMRLGHMSERGMQILSKRDLLGGYGIKNLDFLENQIGKKIKRLRTDNGLEFCSSEFNEFCKTEGIARHHTVRDTSQQNGVAECMNQTLLERARCMLSNVGLPKRFWAEAVSTACYLINRGPHTGIGGKTPYEVWSGKPANYSLLRVFGCTIYYHVSEGKLEPRAKKGIFVGFGDGVKGYRIWSSSEKRVILSKSVIFDESSIFNPTVKSTVAQESDSVDKQVELQITPGESESQHQGGEDQHAAREVDMPESDAIEPVGWSWPPDLSRSVGAGLVQSLLRIYIADRLTLPWTFPSTNSDTVCVLCMQNKSERSICHVLIGEGGFGCVYQGAVRVSDVGNGRGLKMDIAVKKLNCNCLKGFRFLAHCALFLAFTMHPLAFLIENVGHKEWINEVNLLGVVKHPNLVKLVGYCAEDDERGIQRLLVYELMENKSLEDHLLARGLSPLSWIVRLRIVRDAARGLAYLHEEMEFQLIFRDFKTSNILLDEHFNARLSDFGLARQGPAEGNNHVSTSVVGTIGYTAPEYVQTGRLTAKSDVWSFGVVLYELITGRRAVERNLPRGEQKLLEWVRPYISDSKKFHLIIDPRLEQLEQYTESAQKLSSLANKCLMKNPKSRPKMSEVVEALGDIISEIQPREEDAPQSANNIIEDVESKNASKNMKRVFNFREMASLRNKSTRKLDWRNWTTGITKAI